jgi:hypothetical protein
MHHNHTTSALMPGRVVYPSRGRIFIFPTGFPRYMYMSGGKCEDDTGGCGTGSMVFIAILITRQNVQGG